MITKTVKNVRLAALADKFWEAAPDRVKQKEISDAMDQLHALRVMRGDEKFEQSALQDHLMLDFIPADGPRGARPDRWAGNLSGLYDDGYGLLFSLYENRLLTAQEMADAEMEAPYHWIARIKLDEVLFMLEYTEGDVTMWEDN